MGRRRWGEKVKADQAQPDGFSSCSTFSKQSFFLKKKSAFFFFSCPFILFLTAASFLFSTSSNTSPPPLRCCRLPRTLSAEMNGRLFTGHAHLLGLRDRAGLLRRFSWTGPSVLSLLNKRGAGKGGRGGRWRETRTGGEKKG